MIKSIKILPNKLQVLFNNKKKDDFLNIWLRDHAKDELNWDSRSHQRKTFTANINPNLRIKKAVIKDNGKSIDILWSDLRKPINYSKEFLEKNIINLKKSKSLVNLWKAKEINKKVYIDFNDAVSKNGFKKLLKNIYSYGFSVITNCQKNLGSVEKITKKIGYVRQSIFGGLWSFESNKDMADSAYTQNELRPHTDSTYSYDAPGLQLLLCSKYIAEGGESILVDGFKIADEIKKKNKELFKILSSVEVKGQYFGDGVLLEAERPVLKLNSKNELIQVSFNNYDRAPFRLENKLTLKFYESIRKFDKLVNDKKYQWRHILKPGELLIFNNWRILHGRGSFTGTRKMLGCYINKEDFDSSCKIHNIY